MSPNNFSIKNKLVGIIVMAVLATVGIGFAIVITINIRSMRQELVNNAFMNVSIVSEHCVAPLAFDDEKAIAEALQPLHSVPFVENSCVYDTSGRPLATYNRSEEILTHPELESAAREYFEDGFLHVVSPISHNDRELGHMYLKASTKYLDRKINIYFLTMLGIGLGLIGFSYLIALKLQGIISKPILHLATISQDISRQGDYSVRVPTDRTDEIGELYSSFNNMLDQINRRESERDSAEEAVRQSEERYRQLVESAQDAIYTLSPEGTITSLNLAFESMTDWSREEWIGKPFGELLHPDDFGPWQELLESISGGGTSPSHELRVRKKSGDYVTGEFRETVVRRDGELVAILGIARDITDRKRLQEELEYRNILLSTQLENSPDGILVVDPDGVWVFFNRRFITMWNIPDEIEQMKTDEAAIWFVKAQVSDPEGFLSTTNYYYAHPEKKCNDEVLLSDGRVFERYSSSMRGPDGHHHGRVWFFHDLTETRRLQKLESRAERLETAGQIAGQVAHDFNNLLAPLIAYPDFIRDELPEGHPALEYINDMEKSAHKISDINQQLLTLGRRGHYNQTSLNLNTIVEEAIRELGSLADSVILETDLDQNLLSFSGGSSQIHRVLSNLLLNALEAMRDGGRLRIRTENHYVDDVAIGYGRIPKGEYIKLTVSDSGCGIPDDILQRVFDPFFTSKTSDKHRGSGLGLSVVDAVVKDHRGYLDLSTGVGVGTSFYIYFPISREVEVQADADADEISGGDETILVVDDDDVQRTVSTVLLTKLGYEVDTVETGEQAVEFIGEKPRDLVVLDMVMPGGIDGAETYRRILEVSPGQKAVFLSGFSESDRVLEAQKLGAGAFVKKPATRKAIAAAVRTELDREVGSPA